MANPYPGPAPNDPYIQRQLEEIKLRLADLDKSVADVEHKARFGDNTAEGKISLIAQQVDYAQKLLDEFPSMREGQASIREQLSEMGSAMAVISAEISRDRDSSEKAMSELTRQTADSIAKLQGAIETVDRHRKSDQDGLGKKLVEMGATLKTQIKEVRTEVSELKQALSEHEKIHELEAAERRGAFKAVKLAATVTSTLGVLGGGSWLLDLWGFITLG